MNKKNIILLFGLFLIVIFAGCTQQPKESKTVPYTAPEEEEFASVPNAGDAWEAVKIQTVEIETEKTVDYEVTIGGDYVQIKDSNLKIKVEQFIPDFFMGGQNRIGSKSKDLNNPAAFIVVSEEGKPEPFKGWIFSRYPDIHKGASEKISFRLVDFIKKK